MNHKYYRRNIRIHSLQVHIVLVTKYRKKLRCGIVADTVKRNINTIADTRGYEITAMETDNDHIHTLLHDDTTDRVCEYN